MTGPLVRLDELLSCCVDLGTRASRVIEQIAIQSIELDTVNKEGYADEDFQTIADRTAEALIVSLLADSFPSVAVVGEESTDANLDVRATLAASPVAADTRTPRLDIVASMNGQPREPIAGQTGLYEWPGSFIAARSYSDTLKTDVCIAFHAEELREVDSNRICVFVDPLDGTNEFTGTNWSRTKITSSKSVSFDSIITTSDA